MPTSDESPVTTALGRAIRERRVESGLTQEALAEAAGVSARYVSDLERGRRNPGIVNIARLSNALGIDISTLTSTVPTLGPKVR